MKTARNVAIILVIAIPVAFVPAGTVTAAVIRAVLYIVISVLFVAFAARFYIEHRVEIFSLGDRNRLLLYSALAAIVLAFAGLSQWRSMTGGTVAFVARLTYAMFALYRVFLRWRSY